MIFAKNAQVQIASLSKTLIDWLIDWLTDWLTDWSTDQPTDFVTCILLWCNLITYMTKIAYTRLKVIARTT